MDSTQALPTQGQIDLFPWLSAPAKSTVQRIKRPPIQQRPQVQLEIEWLHESAEDDDDPLVKAPITQRTINARHCAPVATCAPSSIFGLAASIIVTQAKRKGGRVRVTPMDEAEKLRESVHLQITRTSDTTRVTRIMHTETDEWIEREEKRRAKQAPPKPGKSWAKVSKV